MKAFRWYGGKNRMTHEINFLIPEHTAYYEPFMGSAAVLLNHPRSRLEVINDLDPDIYHFMKTLADRENGRALIERLWRAWYGRSFFAEALHSKQTNYEGLDDVEKAAMIYILITQSFNCTRKSFSNGGYRSTSDYRDDIQFNLPQVHERLKDVRIRNMDGIDLLAGIASHKSAFAFVDPPYRKELRGKNADRAYACELPHEQQVRLLETIQNAECRIMLCGYRSKKGLDLYDSYLLPHGYKCYKLMDIVKACQNTENKDMAQEFIWVNYRLPDNAKYVINLKEYGIGEAVC